MMKNQTITQLSYGSLVFPPVEQALIEPNGLLAIDGDLSSKRLISAYSQGIFPWFNEQDPILWWSPNPRAVIYNSDLHINKTLKKFLKKSPYTITLNSAFDQVIQLCAHAPFRKEDTWISAQMQQAYIKLHDKGYAHSIEVWRNDELVGGLYGVAINGLFSGESMFYAAPNASKVALIALIQHLKSLGVELIDCQIMNPFLASMGAIDISRSTFMTLKNSLLNITLPENFWQKQPLSIIF
jgi:leucyl/phenylalanyl-tRNA--protein transferase